MKPELRLEIECSGQLRGSAPEPGSSDPARPDSDWMDRCYVPRVRPSEANGFAVYTRNKRLKSRAVSAIGYVEKLQSGTGDLAEAEKAASSNGEIVRSGGDALNVSGVQSDLGTSGIRIGESEGEMTEIEVKEELMVRRFTRSVLKSKVEYFEPENGNLRDTVVLEADGLVSEKVTALDSPKTRKMEMKMSKKILLKGRPATVKELFETGLLEGYPVFYNGGKRVCSAIIFLNITFVVFIVSVFLLFIFLLFPVL